MISSRSIPLIKRNVSEKSLKEKKLCPITFFPENRAVYEVRWKNVAQPVRPQMTTRRMRIACWIPKATNTHWQYVLLIAFPLQQWLHERASMLRLYYIHCLSCYKRNGVYLLRGTDYLNAYIPIQTYTVLAFKGSAFYSVMNLNLSSGHNGLLKSVACRHLHRKTQILSISPRS